MRKGRAGCNEPHRSHVVLVFSIYFFPGRVPLSPVLQSRCCASRPFLASVPPPTPRRGRPAPACLPRLLPPLPARSLARSFSPASRSLSPCLPRRSRGPAATRDLLLPPSLPPSPPSSSREQPCKTSEPPRRQTGDLKPKKGTFLASPAVGAENGRRPRPFGSGAPKMSIGSNLWRKSNT
ncbi:uncharacterized protein C1orf21 homolog isoform X2 [Ahaetulla prasina]|uniref:uncharacterized protein C1orf21 homolog isoform X2 n=1 Tax=Ahaetulla prasina TaxID=499056 RepID=UPI002648D061|nr:uncharacterized protein C1orf21 homolog isoform X2 [Ahaetulla prasina]